MSGSLVTPEMTAFAPGKSPFHVRGNAYRGITEYCQSRVRGGYASVLEHVSDSEVRRFLGQPFLSASWYDVVPIHMLYDAVAAATGGDPQQVMVEHCRVQASRDIRGVYKIMLRLVSPETIIERLPRVANQYFDFVEAEVKEIEPRRWLSIARAIPGLSLGAYRASTEAFLHEALTAAGAKHLKQEWVGQERNGNRGGLEAWRLTREISWSR